MKIIAEVGSNWKTLEDCLFSIAEAKRVGADAVKFQLFNPHEMHGGECTYILGGTPHLDPAWIPGLADQAKNAGIEFMCTAFSPYGYATIDRYVSRHKVASAEITDLDILRTVNSFKKPVYLSTGGATLEQIQAALDVLKDCPVTIMYCVTAYPARVVDFAQLDYMKMLYGPRFSFGYSDHSTDVLIIPSMAQFLGCTVIEKHVNFTSHTDTDDAPHSLSASEFALMARMIRGEKIPLTDTFTPCTWQRVKTENGYFRPMAEL